MSRTQRVSDRFPRFYKYWQKDSVIFSLVQGVNTQLDNIDEEVLSLMKSHWVDTAGGVELDRIGTLVATQRMPEEDDAHFRSRLKMAINEYKGGGTLSAIAENIRALIRGGSEDVEIIENPPAKTSAEVDVIANNTWTLGSNSIGDEEPSITMTVEEGGRVSDPEIRNVDAGESISFKGKLKSGQQLVIKKGKALLDETDVTENMSSQKIPNLLRAGSTWKYSEALLERIGVFDSGKFDEHTFAVGVPTVKIRFEWTRRQPATFLVHVKSKALRDSGVTESYLEKAVESMKAAGVNATIKVRG